MAMEQHQPIVPATQTAGPAEFDVLYDQYRERIYRYIYYRTHHRETAEDLTAQVFLRVWERMKSYDPARGSFSSWIYRIAHNKVIDHYRTSHTSQDIEDVWDALRGDSDLARDAETRERLRHVEDVIRQLPASQREILILRLWDELSYAEIAEMTGKSENACKTAFSRAIAALRKQSPIVILLICLIRTYLL